MTLTHELDVSAWQAFKLGLAFAGGAAVVGVAVVVVLGVAAAAAGPPPGYAVVSPLPTVTP